MSKLFGGSDSTNDELIQWQKAEAAKAEQKAAELKARRENAVAQIRAIYEGGTHTGLPTWTTETVTRPNPNYSPVTPNITPARSATTPTATTPTATTPTAKAAPKTTSQSYNPLVSILGKAFGGGKLVTPQTRAQDAENKIATNPLVTTLQSSLGGSLVTPASRAEDRLNSAVNNPLTQVLGSAFGGGTVRTPDGTATLGADGRPVPQNITETVRKEIPGQSTTYSGIGDDFYDTYRQGVIDYYQPQLEDRFGDAMSETFFDAVRRGTARSSAYADNTADLTKQKGIQSGNIFLDADQQTAGLKNRVNDEMYGAMELASMSEDPTLAVNRALTEVNAVQNASPTLSPLGDVFQLAGSVYNSYNDASRRRQFMSGIPTSNPYTGAGKVFS